MGLNEANRLQQAGIQAKKASVTRVPISQLQLVTSGPTAHPRAKLAPDADLVAWIMQNGMVGRDGVPWRFLCRETGIVDDVMGIEVGNGSRRTNAGRVAEERLRRDAPRTAPLQFNRDDPSDLGRLYVDVELFRGSDAEFLKARLAANSEPGKLPDSTEVLAITVAQLQAVGCTDVAEIVANMPKGVGKKEVHALARWELLTSEARAYFVENDLPPGLLSNVLDAPRDAQLATAKRLHDSGVTTTGGATRTLARDREGSTGEPASKARRWTVPRLSACARAIGASPIIVQDEDVTMTPEEVRALIEQAESNGFAKALKFAAGEKTGKIPTAVRAAIKSVNGKKK